MAEDSLHLPTEQNLDFHIITLFDRLEVIRKETLGLKYSNPLRPKFNMQQEIRTLEFWRSIISECLSSFFYVFIVCGAAAGAGVGASVSSVLLSTALASGFAITALTQCFLHMSGANINPAVTIGLAIARKISPLRSAMYITAQCGGGIAGAALLYGVTVPGYQGNLQSVISHSSTLPLWERFGVEFILTFIVVFTYFVSTDSNCRHFGSTSFTIGAAYSACSFVSMPYLNPARSLGPSFVLNKWENHWVYWLGPLVGGAVSGFVYEYIFNPKRHMNRKNKRNSDNDVSSIQSEDDLNYDLEIEKTQGQQKIHASSNYNTYKSATGTLNPQQQQQQQQGYCQTLYSGPPMNTKIDRVESLYGGTRSLYCKSPPLTRANLNRSQSVYAKSQTAINRDLSGPLRPGPLVPAQSLYPMRLVPTSQSSHAQNQNVQNQMQQRSESIYGIRGSMRQSQQQQQPLPPPPPSNDRMPENQGFQPIYGSRTNPNDGLKYDRDEAMKYNRINRPDSMYGMTGQRRGQSQSAQSDDSSYGSYHGPNSAITPTGRTTGNQNGDLLPPPNYNSSSRNQQTERKISSSNSSNANTNIPNSNSNSNNSNTNSGHPPPPPPLSVNPPNGLYGQKTSTPQTNSLPPHPHQYGGMHPIRQN